MPVRPEFRKHYRTKAWKLARARTLQRAGRKCENCRKPDRTHILTCSGKERFLDGTFIYRMFWMPAGGGRWRDRYGKLQRHLTPPWLRFKGVSMPRPIRPKLSACHRNQVPGDDRDANLACWCEWCHLIFDREQHKGTRCETKDRKRPLLQMIQEAA
jgi:hypothetical protein